MTTGIKIPCPYCPDGFKTSGDRHARTRQDVCENCGGEGVADAKTGETPQTSAPGVVIPTPEEVTEDVALLTALHFLEGLVDNGAPTERKALNPMIVGVGAAQAGQQFRRLLKATSAHPTTGQETVATPRDGVRTHEQVRDWLETHLERATKDSDAHPPGSGNRAFYNGQAVAYENALDVLGEPAPGSAGPGEPISRWEEGFRSIVTHLHGPRHAFEIRDIVAEVAALATPSPAQEPGTGDTGEAELKLSEIAEWLRERGRRETSRLRAHAMFCTAEALERQFPATTDETRGPADRENVGLGDLQRANVERQKLWCPDNVPDLSFRGNELAGEGGEAVEAMLIHAAEMARAIGNACNLVKKLERERHGWMGSRTTKAALANELGDVVICTILCAITADIPLSPAVVDKFNETSEKMGLPIKL